MKIKHIIILLAVFTLVLSCNKDSENGKDYNMLKVTSGSNSGYTQVYSPNQGYWADVSATAKYVHLLFGSADNMVVQGKDVISILYYDEGLGMVTFPSAQGQHVNIGFTVDGAEKYYMADGAQLTIQELSDNRFIGYLAGQFISTTSSETINVTMDIDVEMIKLR
jgi:hypothetical protein